MISILDISAEEDISQFSRLLWQRKISHRMHEENGRQYLLVANQEQAYEASGLYRQWVQGEIQPDEDDSSDVSAYFRPSVLATSMLAAFLKAPLSLTLVVVCCVLLFIAPLNDMTDIVRSMLFPDFSFGTRIINLDRVLESFSFVTLLKMISPILLHGGLLHLAFNMLWLWEFGRRVEAVQTSWALLLLITVVALFSNTAQFLYGGSIYFGGMSGVVYGLFGYIWMWQVIDPAKGLSLPGALVFFLLLSLAIMTAMNIEFIADEAHIGGLATGMVCGIAAALFSRLRRNVAK